MSGIRLKESCGTFVYFFVFTLALAFVGAKFPPLAQNISEIMQEHIAGKTIMVFSGLTVFFAFFCATNRMITPREYGKTVKLLVLAPSNFIITLAFVAAAMNWALAISSTFLFPLAVNGEVFLQLARNSLEITGIALGLGLTAWVLHWSPDLYKKQAPFETPRTSLFWIVYTVNTIFWGSFFATIIFKIIF